jgi:hypothetical protein
MGIVGIVKEGIYNLGIFKSRNCIGRNEKQDIKVLIVKVGMKIRNFIDSGNNRNGNSRNCKLLRSNLYHKPPFPILHLKCLFSNSILHILLIMSYLSNPSYHICLNLTQQV